MHEAQRIPLALRDITVVAMVLLVSGCAFTPAKSVQRRSELIGDGPQAVIRVGESDRETVLRTLGTPSYATQNNLAVGYLFSVTTGTASGLLMGPCMPAFGTTQVCESDDVWLEFDRRGILARVEKRLVEKNANSDEAAWRQFIAPVPDTIRPATVLDGKSSGWDDYRLQHHLDAAVKPNIPPAE